MTVTFELHDGVAVFKAGEACGESTARDMLQVLVGNANAHKAIVFDFARSEVIDSAHLAMMLRLATDPAHERRIAVVASQRVAESFGDWRVDDWVTTFSELDEALALIRKGEGSW